MSFFGIDDEYFMYLIIVLVMFLILLNMFSTNNIVEGLISKDKKVDKLTEQTVKDMPDLITKIKSDMDFEKNIKNLENIIIDYEEYINLIIIGELVANGLKNPSEIVPHIQIVEYLPKLMDYLQSQSS